jgi:hypothetical protein
MKLSKKKTTTIPDLRCSISCTLLVCQSTSPKGGVLFLFWGREGLNEFVIMDEQGNYKVWVLGAEVDFEAPTCQTTTNFHSEPKSFCNQVGLAFGKVLLAAVNSFSIPSKQRNAQSLQSGSSSNSGLKYHL